jgi:hypothetical protein
MSAIGHTTGGNRTPAAPRSLDARARAAAVGAIVIALLAATADAWASGVETSHVVIVGAIAIAVLNVLVVGVPASRDRPTAAAVRAWASSTALGFLAAWLALLAAGIVTAVVTA